MTDDLTATPAEVIHKVCPRYCPWIYICGWFKLKRRYNSGTEVLASKQVHVQVESHGVNKGWMQADFNDLIF